MTYIISTFILVFGHPEVYIIVIPAFGVISQVISAITEKQIFWLFWYGICNDFYWYFRVLLFGHHMYTVGMDVDTRGYFTAATMIIAVPTGIKIFSWLATIWGGLIKFKTTTLFALGFNIIYIWRCYRYCIIK